ncbi:MAG: hypothetical protein H7645_12730 [Candidatus Heimdallarchaeota archaeon]|nr:hypothetical protein [Candidatus Heimdallarchaeota archaeon]MCK4771193.1 hypothetical protein [Candidatus Heimdallarchaeota archaeon]
MRNPNVTKEPSLVFSIFKDYGPEILFNNSILEENTALTLVMSGMTLVEMNKGSIGKVDGTKNPKMLGPIPVPEHENIKAIAVPFETAITSSADERIAASGYRLCVAYFLFEGLAVREVLDSYGLIEPYFTMIARSLQKESGINQSSIKQMYTRMKDMFSGKIPRIYGLNQDNTLKEMIGKRLEYADTYLLCDMDKKVMYILLYNPSVDVWRKRAIFKTASELNSTMFRSALRIKTIEDIKEMTRILDVLNIEISPV